MTDAPDIPADEVRKRLAVELDFEHAPPDIAVRFEMIGRGRRQALRTQDLHNVAARIRQGDNDGWSADDASFIKQLQPLLDKPGVLRSNLQVLRIHRNQLERWLDRWRHLPRRFIEHRSQQPYSRSLAAGIIRIDLTVLGDETELAAIVALDNGQETPWHEVRASYDATRGQAIVAGQPARLELDLPADLLTEIWGRGPRRVPTAPLPAHLPTLLQGHLELLGGPGVQRRRIERDPEVRIRAEGGDFLVGVAVGEAMIADPGSGQGWELSFDGRQFQLHEYRFDTHKHALRRFLKALPLRETDGHWRRLLGRPDHIEALRAARAKLPATIRLRPDVEAAQVFAAPSTVEMEVETTDHGGWCELRLRARVGDRLLDDSECRSLLRGRDPVIRTRDGHWLEVEAESAAAARRFLRAHRLRVGSQRVSRVELSDLAAGLDAATTVGRSARELFADLRAAAAAPPLELTPGLEAALRDYQKVGARFLHNRGGYGVGCILADDMGLGKTVQVLAGVAAWGDTALVVCPASVQAVWVAEAKRWTPELRVRAYAGGPDARTELLTAGEWDVLVTTYAVLRNDVEALGQFTFGTVILDEAQQIKNPAAQVTVAAKRLHAARRIAVTGTPLENRLLDLWSIMEFLNPGYFGSREEFAGATPGPVLRQRLAPLLLRRTKADVAPELPPRTVEVLDVPMAPAQAERYAAEVAAARAALREAGPVEIFAALTRLRQICCDPALIDGEGAAPSGKLEALLDQLDELAAEGHAALVFSQFTSMLAIIRDALAARHLHYMMITGETPPSQRAILVQEFQEADKPMVALLSLRAAGTGITLTRASYVFLYDPWWNPAVENQAIDRAHRIGQHQPVTAYKLVAAGTVEHRVLALQAEKQQLFAATVDGAADLAARLSLDDLRALLA